MKVPAIFCAAALAAGCAGTSPYATRDAWVLRQNEVPQYATQYDVVYANGANVRNDGSRAAAIHERTVERLQPFGVLAGYAKETGRKARVFAPSLDPAERGESAKMAVKHYLGHYRDAGRPFAVLVEGPGAGEIAAALDSMEGWFGDLSREDGYMGRAEPGEGAEAMKALERRLDAAAKALILERVWGSPAGEAEAVWTDEERKEAMHGLAEQVQDPSAGR